MSTRPELDESIDRLNLSAHTHNSLEKAAIRTIGDLTKMTAAELSATNDVCELCIKEIEGALVGIGLSLQIEAKSSEEGQPNKSLIERFSEQYGLRLETNMIVGTT